MSAVSPPNPETAARRPLRLTASPVTSPTLVAIAAPTRFPLLARKREQRGQPVPSQHRPAVRAPRDARDVRAGVLAPQLLAVTDAPERDPSAVATGGHRLAVRGERQRRRVLEVDLQRRAGAAAGVGVPERDAAGRVPDRHATPVPRHVDRQRSRQADRDRAPQASCGRPDAHATAPGLPLFEALRPGEQQRASVVRPGRSCQPPQARTERRAAGDGPIGRPGPQ